MGQDNLEHNLQLLQGYPGYNLFKKNIEENKDNKDNIPKDNSMKSFY